MEDEKKNKYCCEKHTDMAFDDFLVENETYPCIENAENGNCDYCGQEAKYILKLAQKEK